MPAKIGHQGRGLLAGLFLVGLLFCAARGVQGGNGNGNGGLVGRGPYRFLRHPNYLAVVVEIAAVPLVYGAWWTALGFSVANLLVLRTRVPVEEAALRTAAGDSAE